MGKGYLKLDGYPQFQTWVVEIDDEASPTFFANDAKGPIPFCPRSRSNHNVRDSRFEVT
jgi:hypothetical protein